MVKDIRVHDGVEAYLVLLTVEQYHPQSFKAAVYSLSSKLFYLWFQELQKKVKPHKEMLFSEVVRETTFS